MSGHSHYATTKRQKELKDNARGQVFSKLSRSITIAAKTGGGPDPDSNFKLRIAIDKAKALSMPKENIDRAVSKGANSSEAFEEMMYEGFGPGGFSVLVEAATDNKNRTSAEIRNLFEKNGGKVASPGAVSFNFEPKGLLVIKTEENKDEQLLKLIDLGAEDVEEGESEMEIYVSPNKLSEMQKKFTDNGIVVISSELMQKPKSFQDIPAEKVEQATSFLQNFDDHDDVQEVYTNANF
ncbi:YebC/PmpR family DNA-binding transcriptional regulator [soil metagenome]